MAVQIAEDRAMLNLKAVPCFLFLAMASAAAVEPNPAIGSLDLAA